jgi:hypothetical protein
VRLAFSQHLHGVHVPAGNRVTYDVSRNEAHFGQARVDGHALVWELGDEGEPLDLDREASWLMRCDRVDFPPGGVAYRHTHPGPGIRCLLRGSISIESGGRTESYGPFESWFESGPEPVFAAASDIDKTAFVRVLVLPREWEGRRTIRYVDPADEDKPKTQRATVFLERPIEL